MSRSLAVPLVCTAVLAAGCQPPPGADPTGARPPARDPLGDRAAPALASITGTALAARVRFLADDALEGRAPGERGYTIAARYVASELASFGLRPAGSGGDFFQPVPLRGMMIDFARSALVVRGRTGAPAALRPETDFFLLPDGSRPVVDVDAPLVFVGYGVSAPEYGYDDTVGLDLRGKIAVALYGAPLSPREDFFPTAAHAHYSDREGKMRSLKARGAVGLLTVQTPDLDRMARWDHFVGQMHFERMVWLEDGAPGSTIPMLRGFIARGAFDRLIARSGRSGSVEEWIALGDRRELRGFDLGLSASARVVARHRDMVADNVAAVLPGSDPALAGEYVVYTAHLDHLGIGKPVAGDAIYNGADDNASGSAAVLELARAFARLPAAPRRSLLFLLVTAEEKGLLGSDYFARHPTVPADAMVASINIDGAYVPWRLHDVVAIGAEHSTLARDVDRAAKVAGLVVSPDPEPQLVFFIRSDQYSFVKVGVPSLFLQPGLLDASGRRDANRATWAREMERRYHTPMDAYEPNMTFDEGARLVRHALLVGLSVAMADERPSWNPGGFYARFAGRRPD